MHIHRLTLIVCDISPTLLIW